MRPRLCPLVMILCMACAGSGCRLATSERPPYPQDPLLLSKKPADEPAEPAARTMLAALEPAAPPFPATALAQRRTTEPAPAHTVASPRREVPIIPAVRSRTRPMAGQVLGHAPDHAWLQGILERHHEGYFHLRYADPTPEKPWGGNVRLEDDPRLTQYQDGDVVRVEGGLVPVTEPIPARWDQAPRYRFQVIQLLRSRS